MKMEISESRWRIFLPTATLVIALLIRLWGIDDRTVWMDEDRQATISTASTLDIGVSIDAAGQQQPPLDYYLESVGIENLGLSGLGIRINAAILGALAALAFALILLRHVRNRFVVVSGALLFAFHPWLVRYSQEGRPTSLGVFCAVIFLAALLSLFREGDSRGNLSRKLALLTGAQFVFLVSIGLQPIVFLATSAVSLVPILFVRGYTKRVLLIWGSTLLAFLLAYPILAELLTHAGSHMEGGESITSVMSTLVSRLDRVEWGLFLDTHRALFESWFPLILLTLVAGIVGLARGDCTRENRLEFAYMGLLSLLYPFVFAILYGTLVNRAGGIPPRYYLTLAPAVLLLLAIAGRLAYDATARIGEIRPRARNAVLVLFAAAAIWGAIGNASTMGEMASRENRRWDQLYELFMDRDVGMGFAYTINFCPPGSWSPGFWSKRFYYPHERRLVTLKREWNFATDYRKPALWSKRRNLFLVTVKGDQFIEDGVLDGISNVDLIRFHKLVAIRISEKGDKKDRVFQVLIRLRERIEVSQSSHMLTKLLYDMARMRGDEDVLARSCDELETLKGPPKINKLWRECKKTQRSIRR